MYRLLYLPFSAAEAGNVEPSINHPGVDEEEQRVQEDEANQTIADDLVTRYESIEDEVAPTGSKTLQPEKPVNVSRPLEEESIVESLQRDQSDLASVNDVHEMDPLGSSESSGRNGGKDFVASTRPSRVEIASSVGSSRVVDDVQAEDEGLSNVVEGSNVDKWRRGFTTVSIRGTAETVSTERPIERKKVEDIRAISFQVPAIVEEEVEEGKEQPRKDHSRPVNNLLLTGGKSTKAFYEIKPSIKTEMEGGGDQQASPTIDTQRPLAGRKFVLPSVDSAFGKFGPYFEDGDQEINITARIGSTMLLDCKIGMLGNKEVKFHFITSVFSFPV